jgi:hypothetical protein
MNQGFAADSCVELSPQDDAGDVAMSPSPDVFGLGLVASRTRDESRASSTSRTGDFEAKLAPTGRSAPDKR